MKKIVIYHPFGNANARAAVDGIYKQGLLESFHTCIACFKGSLIFKLSFLKPLREVRRRTFSLFLKDKTFSYPFKELVRQIALKTKLNGLVAHEKGRFCVDEVCHHLDRKVSNYVAKHRESVGAVYAYEDLALRTFTVAKGNHILCIYDLPIGYWRAMHTLLEVEKSKSSEWAVTLGGFNDSNEKLQQKDRELALADRIYVASTFTKKTLEMYPGVLAPIEVIPYGFPPVNNERIYESFNGRNIRILYVGGLSQRKGIAYFFEALEGLENKVEVTVVGRGMIEECAPLKKALSKVHYIPSLPHQEVLQLMAMNDLLIFPSLFEGFGLVITEAMSQGTPVITTDRTCGPDVITHGIDGWIVEAGTSTPIKELIHKFISDPTLLREAGKHAMETAAQRPWEVYEQELAESVNKFLNDKLS